MPYSPLGRGFLAGGIRSLEGLDTDDIALIPGTKRVARLEENTAADGIVLTPDQFARLNALPAASGERHDETGIAAIDR